MSLNQPSSMLAAFLSQTKINDKEADRREAAISQQKTENYNKALSLLSRSQSISDYTKIESKLKNGELNQKTEVHKNFKNYDHSLEKVRIKFPTIQDQSLETGDIADMLGNMFDDDSNLVE